MLCKVIAGAYNLCQNWLVKYTSFSHGNFETKCCSFCLH